LIKEFQSFNRKRIRETVLEGGGRFGGRVKGKRWGKREEDRWEGGRPRKDFVRGDSQSTGIE